MHCQHVPGKLCIIIYLFIWWETQRNISNFYSIENVWIQKLLDDGSLSCYEETEWFHQVFSWINFGKEVLSVSHHHVLKHIYTNCVVISVLWSADKVFHMYDIWQYWQQWRCFVFLWFVFTASCFAKLTPVVQEPVGQSDTCRCLVSIQHRGNSSYNTDPLVTFGTEQPNSLLLELE